MIISHRLTHILLMLTASLMLTVVTNAQIGSPIPAASAMSDMKAGSVLFYPFYTSNTTRPTIENTKFNLTNTHTSQMVFVHLFFIETSGCQPADVFVCLTANQTFTWVASEYDPDITGYCIAVASDKDTGVPIQFNNLAGDYFVKLTSGHTANAGALAFSALNANPAPVNPDGTTVSLKFDDTNYNAAPRMLMIDNIPSRADGNDTFIVLTRLGGDLVNQQNTSIGGLMGLLYDDAEKGYSFTMTAGSCQFRTSISDNSPRTVPRFSTIVRSGRSGWMKFWPSSDIAVVGIVLNYNSNPAGSANNYTGGHTLHPMSQTTTSVITIPLFPPSC